VTYLLGDTLTDDDALVSELTHRAFWIE
jgi:hypothetical protein